MGLYRRDLHLTVGDLRRKPSIFDALPEDMDILVALARISQWLNALDDEQYDRIMKCLRGEKG